MITKYSHCKWTIDQSQLAYHGILTTWDEAMENARGWSWGITSKRYSKGRQLLVWGKSCKTCTTKIEKSMAANDFYPYTILNLHVPVCTL